MDIATLGFVALLCLVAFFVTATIRRDFRSKEHERREQERHARHQPPQRKP